MSDDLRTRIAAALNDELEIGLHLTEKLADAFLAIPGIAVVELPEPERREPATDDVNSYVEWHYPHGSIATTDDGTIMWERWHIHDPSKVRAAAAALLAAAEYAERDQGRTWEWCGGQPGTWAWRITNLTAHAEREQ